MLSWDLHFLLSPLLGLQFSTLIQICGNYGPCLLSGSLALCVAYDSGILYFLGLYCFLHMAHVTSMHIFSLQVILLLSHSESLRQ